MKYNVYNKGLYKKFHGVHLQIGHNSKNQK